MTSTPRIPPERRSIAAYQRGLLAVATVLVAAGSAAFVVDLPVATWCKSNRLPGELGRVISLLEISGHSLGAALMLVAAVLLDGGLRVPVPGRWRAGEKALAGMVTATYLGGLIVDIIKLSVARVRPRAADLASVGSWLGTFGEGSLMTDQPRLTDLMSFPSGHSAVAAGLAAALTWRYPRGLPLFAMLAAATAVQRVTSSAHYPSDACFGAAIGLIAAACCLGGPRPSRAVAPTSGS